MKVLVTGANGFVGGWLVQALLAAGYDVVGADRPGTSRDGRLSKDQRAAVRWVPLELDDPASVREVAAIPCDALVHLAAVASGGEALRDPGVAWSVNAGGTARLLGELGRLKCAGALDPLIVVASTAEVYGGEALRPLVETDPVAPRSPYAASKLGAELAARETAARTGLRVVVARAFPHTGPGQDNRFVAPAFAERLRVAVRAGARVVKVGNLEPVRDFLDVRDVAAAYVALLARGLPDDLYNVASGTGVKLSELFERLAAIIGVEAIPEVDAQLVRRADIPYLVGDAGKLRAATLWRPAITLQQSLRDMVDAQAR